LAISVSESFVKDTECLNCPANFLVYRNGRSGSPILEQFPGLLNSLWSKAHTGKLERLEPIECIKDYATSKRHP
jgi:hypothetical protein